MEFHSLTLLTTLNNDVVGVLLRHSSCVTMNESSIRVLMSLLIRAVWPCGQRFSSEMEGPDSSPETTDFLPIDVDKLL